MSGEEGSAEEKKGSSLINVSIGRDVLGVAQGVTALVQAIERGIGCLFDVWHQRRIAEAEQTNALGWLQVIKESGTATHSLEVSTQDGRSKLRLYAEEARQQQSRENVAAYSLREAALLRGAIRLFAHYSPTRSAFVGTPPSIEYLHSPVMVDNSAGTISVAA